MSASMTESSIETHTWPSIYRLRRFSAKDKNIGRLLPVVDLASLEETISPSALIIFTFLRRSMHFLGRAVQLDCHHSYIESIDIQLNQHTLIILANAALNDRRLISKLSVYLTTIEQAYHWPRDVPRKTPRNIEEHKLIFQVLLHEELHSFLKDNVRNLDDLHHISTHTINRALKLSRNLICEALSWAKQLSRYKYQDDANLLYRTSRGDWYDQSHYEDEESHLEFGRLHETTHTNGTQRRLQELFEKSGALSTLQRFPELMTGLPSTSSAICAGLMTLQQAIVLCREELYNMMFDEVIWGKTFARFSKGVGASDIGGGGADTPLFKMIDALCGREKEDISAALLQELDFRSQFFPPNMRRLINALSQAPSLRRCVATAGASDELKRAFNGLQQIYYDLYKMHRKKAMRILLSLSAGQQGTSSGTQKAASPSQHIMASLSQSMDGRFGCSPEIYQIDAICTSRPLIEGESTCILGAQVLVELATPLVVLPGDAVSLAININNEGWLTRTYSVTSIVEAGVSEEQRLSCPLASALEICVRITGANVSTYICNQEIPFVAKVMVLPSPHFRLALNKSSTDQTFLFGQGAGVGIFTGWLKGQSTSVGSYNIIVGVRDPHYLPFKQELWQLAKRPNVKVIIATPNLSLFAHEFLVSMGLVAFSGRVDAYIKQLSQWGEIDAYICGCAEFGVSMIAAISEHQKEVPRCSPFSPLYSPIFTSRAPRIRLHVSSTGKFDAVDNCGLRCITSAELALHNMPQDVWVAIGSRVYDITPFIKFHPGGEKIILHVAGRQGKDLMDMIHGNSFEVQAILAQFLIGRLIPDIIPSTSLASITDWEQRLESLVQMQNNLTNGSRFERWPQPNMPHPSESPPAYVIRTSVSQFISRWSSWAEAATKSDTTKSNFETEYEIGAGLAYVHAQTDSLTDAVDFFLKQTFDMSFDSKFECTGALALTYTVYAQIVSSIQHGLQELKLKFQKEANAEVGKVDFGQELGKFAWQLGSALHSASSVFKYKRICNEL
jgi:ferredoxin-NADP reductase